VLALALVPGLVGLAAAQPVVTSERSRPERTDAQAVFVLDVSRSMLASRGAKGALRIQRARAAALRLRQSLGEVPVGLASLTDRLLPHVFPTGDERVFATTLKDSIGIERPPPALFYSTMATAFDALAVVPRRNYFAPAARKRLLVVFTDGESRAPEPELARAFQAKPRIETIFVRFWNADERIYETGVEELGYKPDPETEAQLRQAAAMVGGRVYSEGQTAAVAAAARAYFGSGPTRAAARQGERLALMPYVTLAAFLPLAFLLWRRNL
jgi:uncharacterized protein (DUF58 family)